MPSPDEPLEQLGFLTIGSFDPDDPRSGHETTLEVVALGERLGFDSAWLRHRHLQFGISSPVAVLAAATQRTRRIALGTAVTPLGWENPLRLAEDLATVDVLSGGRLNPGFSVGPPTHYDRVKAVLYPDSAEAEEFGQERAVRLLRLVRGEPASSFAGVEGIEVFADRVQPHSPGLAARMWCGAASVRSARWTGEQGLNLSTSSVVRAEGSIGDAGPAQSAQSQSARSQSAQSWDFAQIQAEHVRAFRAASPAGEATRVSQGLVVIPTDTATAAQRAKYAAYVQSRSGRAGTPQGPGRLLFERDLLGTSAEIAESLYGHAGFREVREVAFALPFSFAAEDYEQILTDIATGLGPALGWHPAS